MTLTPLLSAMNCSLSAPMTFSIEEMCIRDSISIYLILSGIPAIREIGLGKFLFGKVWDQMCIRDRPGMEAIT